MRTISTLFTGLRRASNLIHTATPVIKNYFYVDTNVIIGYRKKQYEKINLSRFIEDPSNQFLYTETVLKELQVSSAHYPESSPDANIPEKRFRFIRSRITEHHKEKAVELLHELWVNEFKHDKKAIVKGFGLSDEQLEKFKKDLFIIFEAGITCYARGVLPDDDLRAPPLITNNMELFNKFISREKSKTLLENAINLSGLEHLIPVQLLADTVEDWEKEQSQLTTSPQLK